MSASRTRVLLVITILLFACRGSFAENSKGSPKGVDRDKPKPEVLFKAVKSGNIIALRHCIEEGVDVRCRDRHNFSALDWALFLGHKGIIDYLHGAGAEPTPGLVNPGVSSFIENECCQVICRVGKAYSIMIADTANRYLAYLRNVYFHGQDSVKRTGKVVIRLFESKKAFLDFRRQRKYFHWEADWLEGCYNSHRMTVYFYYSGNGIRDLWVLLHELTHHSIAMAAKGRHIPSCIHEGLAVYLSTAYPPIREMRIHWNKIANQKFKAYYHPWIPLSKLLQVRSVFLLKTDAAREWFYFQSWAVIRFLACNSKGRFPEIVNGFIQSGFSKKSGPNEIIVKKITGMSSQKIDALAFSLFWARVPKGY